MPKKLSPEKVAIGIVQIQRENGHNIPTDAEALAAYDRWAKSQETTDEVVEEDSPAQANGDGDKKVGNDKEKA